MTVISNNAIARSVWSLSKDKSRSEQTDISKKIVQFLFRRRLLLKAPDILLQLKKIIDSEEGRVVAKVSSVEKLDHKMKTHLEQFLKKHYSAKEVVLEENLNKKLLGGIRVEVDNEVLDLSMKNKVEKLKAHLTKD